MRRPHYAAALYPTVSPEVAESMPPAADSSYAMLTMVPYRKQSGNHPPARSLARSLRVALAVGGDWVLRSMIEVDCPSVSEDCVDLPRTPAA